MPKAALEVIDRRIFASFGFGSFQHERPGFATRKRIPDPISAVPDAATVPAIWSGNRVSIPSTRRITRFGYRDVYRFLLFLVPRIPQIKSVHLIVCVVEKFRVNAAIEGPLRNALNELAFFRVDDQAMVGGMQHVFPSYSDLRIDLPIAVRCSIKHENVVEHPGIAAQFAFRNRSVPVKGIDANGLDRFGTNGLYLLSQN